MNNFSKNGIRMNMNILKTQFEVNMNMALHVFEYPLFDFDPLRRRRVVNVLKI